MGPQERIDAAIAALPPERAREILARVAGVLWPEGDAGHAWDADTCDEVARALTDEGITPTCEHDGGTRGGVCDRCGAML